MEMPKPTDAHRKLERLVGRWIGEEQLFPSPWDPKGGTAIGRINNQLALDGFAVIQDYEQERNGAITFRGHAVFQWDAMKQSYVCYWFDSMGMPVNEYRGTFEDNVLSVTSPMQKGFSRAVFDVSQDGQYTFRMDVSEDGNQWQTFMEGTYQREN